MGRVPADQHLKSKAEPREGIQEDEENNRPQIEVETFMVENVRVPYMMTIVNGDAAAASQVHSATIILNGVVVARPEGETRGDQCWDPTC